MGESRESRRDQNTSKSMSMSPAGAGSPPAPAAAAAPGPVAVAPQPPASPAAGAAACGAAGCGSEAGARISMRWSFLTPGGAPPGPRCCCCACCACCAGAAAAGAPSGVRGCRQGWGGAGRRQQVSGQLTLHGFMGAPLGGWRPPTCCLRHPPGADKQSKSMEGVWGELHRPPGCSLGPIANGAAHSCGCLH